MSDLFPDKNLLVKFTVNRLGGMLQKKSRRLAGFFASRLKVNILDIIFFLMIVPFLQFPHPFPYPSSGRKRMELRGTLKRMYRR